MAMGKCIKHEKKKKKNQKYYALKQNLSFNINHVILVYSSKLQRREHVFFGLKNTEIN